MRELKRVLLQTVALFITIAALTGTAYAQRCLDNDSLIHYTDKMDKKALTCLVNAPKKDSLIVNLGLKIDLLRYMTVNREEVIDLNNIKITGLEKDVKIKDKKIAFLTKLTIYGLPVGFGVGFLAGAVLLK